MSAEQQPLRLNLGCGDDRREGFVNVDQRTDVADVVASADDLSQWADSSVEEIQAFDLLEHFWRDDTEAVLAEWRRVLKPGGLLRLRVPNLLALGQQIVEAERQAPSGLARLRTASAARVEDTVENVYGGHRWGPAGAWDTHHWGFTPRSLERQLEACGFVVLSNDRRMNMTVVAQKEGR